MQRPESMSALDAAAAIERGSLTCEALARACLERIAAREPVVHAWRELDAERMLARARELDRSPRMGPLHGLPVAIKDIIATADFPTRYGSTIYEDHQPPADAACVSLVKAQGAVIPGKTVTTEFAYFQPGPTANPVNSHHTPGGSSSGSAAAVADWMVPLALGTQTAGSVIRPAAFCGIVGFKPTFGRLNLTGAKPFAPNLDTLGCFARDVGDIELLRSALTGDAYRPLQPPAARVRVGVYRSREWSIAEPQAQQVVLDVAEHLRSDADVLDVDVPAADAATDAQAIVMAFEAAQSLSHEYRAHRDALSPRLVGLIESGRAVSYADYVTALRAAAGARTAFRAVLDAYDVLLMPSAPGEAPRGLAATGDPIFNRGATMLGVPAITLPVGKGDHGLPLGVQLIGAWDRDRDLLAIAHWLYARVRADR
jgi:Asp-tRNA(Asn)/Glu-tRNA(Gln) amidotransferase A subunit family amidase